MKSGGNILQEIKQYSDLQWSKKVFESGLDEYSSAKVKFTTWS